MLKSFSPLARIDFFKAFQHVHIPSITIPLTPDALEYWMLKDNARLLKKKERMKKNELLYIFFVNGCFSFC